MVTKGRGLFSVIISRCKNHKIIILYSKNSLLTGDYIFIILFFFDLILQDLFGGEAQAVRWVGAPLVERPIVLWRETQKYFIAQILEILRKQTRPVKKPVTIFNFWNRFSNAKGLRIFLIPIVIILFAKNGCQKSRPSMYSVPPTWLPCIYSSNCPNSSKSIKKYMPSIGIVWNIQIFKFH